MNLNRTGIESILSMKNISKKFPGVQALDDVSLDVKSGAVHALIGENGAGKSTLMKILTGIYTADTGTIVYQGDVIHPKNPREMADRGVSIIHQEFNLIPHLTVAENIFITREPRKFRNTIIDDKRLIEETKKLLRHLDISLDPKAKLAKLSVAEKQMVEITKALAVNSEILVLDEPTSALAEKEVQKLFEIIRDLKNRGVAIIYISHRLEEFEAIVDEVTTLRDGRYVSTSRWSDTSIPQLVRNMVGRSLDNQFPERNHDVGEIVFEARNIRRGRQVNDISLKVRKGEVVGLAGLMGAGRSEFARAVFGADRMESGTLYLDGREFVTRSPSDAIHNGITYLPEDRKLDGLFLDLEVQQNIMYATYSDNAVMGVVDDKRCRKKVDRVIRDLQVKTPTVKQLVGNLSGGNQQKVLIGRWLLKDLKVFIFDEPTRGIDVGAKFEVYNLINRLAEQGAAIIMISSEMPEILGLSDRIYVLCEGRLMGEMDAREATQEKILRLASGLTERIPA